LLISPGQIDVIFKETLTIRSFWGSEKVTGGGRKTKKGEIKSFGEHVPRPRRERDVEQSPLSSLQTKTELGRSSEAKGKFSSTHNPLEEDVEGAEWFISSHKKKGFPKKKILEQLIARVVPSRVYSRRA